MAIAGSRPLQPLADPPTTALPPLPASASSNSAPSSTASTSNRRHNASAAPLPASTSSRLPALPTSRLPSASNRPRTPARAGLPVTSSSPSLQTNKASSPVTPISANKTIDDSLPKSVTADPSKSADNPLNDGSTNATQPPAVTLAAFPQPPRSSPRRGSATGRPVLIGTLRTTSLDSPTLSPESGALKSNSTSPSGLALPKRVKKSPSASTLPNSPYASSPSLMNGSSSSVPLSATSQLPRSASSQHLPRSVTPSSRRSSADDAASSTLSSLRRSGGQPVTSSSRASTRHPRSASRAHDKESKGNVLVSVRVRPTEGSETPTDREWMVDGRRSLVAYRGREGGEYVLDNVFAPQDSNEKVYEACAKRLVRRVMEGYHGVVFAYGMTGTGKTFSMQGTAVSPGVIPKAITDIFSFIRETPHREFLLRASYLEIYNEDIRDLLAEDSSGLGGGPPEKIQLRQDGKRGVYATPLREEIVQSPMQLLRVIARGDKARHTGTTQYNVHSSRSHAVVKIVVESRDRSDMSLIEDRKASSTPGGVRVSTLSLIDLAGSERAAETKERRTEGAHINKSLLTLGTVIARLSGDQDKDKAGTTAADKEKHLPYRDSKLTRLLQPALSGDSLISILCTIQIGSTGSMATANTHSVETLNTLKFASRAKNNIVSHAKRAEEASGAANGDSAARGLLERYRLEIQGLRDQLDEQSRVQAGKEERQQEKEAEDRHKDQLLEMQLARTALKERIEHLNRLILSSKSHGVNYVGSRSLALDPGPASARSSQTASSEFSAGRSAYRSVRSSASIASILQRSASGASTATAQSGRSSRRSRVDSALSPATLDVNWEDATDADAEADEDEPSFEDHASVEAQNRALQVDLADKTRYIATLEKRLLHARRNSHSRTSAAYTTALLQQKEAQISSLQSQVDEQAHALSDLRAEIAQLRGRMSSQTSSGKTSEDGSTSLSHTQSTHTASTSAHTSDASMLQLQMSGSEDSESSGMTSDDSTARGMSPFELLASPLRRTFFGGDESTPTKRALIEQAAPHASVATRPIILETTPELEAEAEAEAERQAVGEEEILASQPAVLHPTATETLNEATTEAPGELGVGANDSLPGSQAASTPDLQTSSTATPSGYQAFSSTSPSAFQTASPSSFAARRAGARRSIDGLSQILDQMIQSKVERDEGASRGLSPGRGLARPHSSDGTANDGILTGVSNDGSKAKALSTPQNRGVNTPSPSRSMNLNGFGFRSGSGVQTPASLDGQASSASGVGTPSGTENEAGPQAGVQAGSNGAVESSPKALPSPRTSGSAVRAMILARRREMAAAAAVKTGRDAVSPSSPTTNPKNSPTVPTEAGHHSNSAAKAVAGQAGVSQADADQATAGQTSSPKPKGLGVQGVAL